MKRLFLATALSLCAATAFAQAWPSKPVRIINGFSAGGPSDRDPSFREAVHRFLLGERRAQEAEMAEMAGVLPYRDPTGAS